MKRNKLLIYLLVILLASPTFLSCIETVDAIAPTVTTNDATGITGTNATLQGTLTNDGNASFPYEYYTSGDDSSLAMYVDSGNSVWCSQTFTVGTVGANIIHYIKSISLKLWRSGTPGIITVSINATNITTGYPIAGGLSVGTTNGNTLTTSASGEWRNITLSWCPLSISTKYAIVVRTSSVLPDLIRWCCDLTSSTYVGGCSLQSANGGVSWFGSSYDFMFKVYGNGCNASFDYGFTSGYGTSTLNQVKVTGNTVSQNIASLINGKLYHFRAKAINSDGTTNGLDKTFLTKPIEPTNITKTPYTTAINLTWTKGFGANRTVIRYSDSFYPTLTTGMPLYNNTGTVVNTTSLTSGKTYFFSIWGFTIWGSLWQYSEITNTYASTLSNATSSFTINFPEYLEVGEYILASGTIVNNTGIPSNNIWMYTYICNDLGVNVSKSYDPFWVVDGYYDYKFSTSTMVPGVYFIHMNFTQTGTNYNATNILYLSQPGGMGHARAMVYFTYYNTNEGIGLPAETLKLYVNDTRIYRFPLSYESYTGALINVKVKDYYNFTMFEQNYTINNTIEPIDLGLTFHSWLFGNSNNKAYMVSLLKQGATRWWERGIVPYGQVEYLIPSGNYTMRIYDSLYHELMNQSFLITNSRVYVINGTNLTLVINGQSIIIGQLLETIQYALIPDVRTICTNPPMVYSIYDTDGMSLGNGVYKICPAVITIATTKTTQSGNWINSSPSIPTNGTVINGTITILKDELYIAGNASITWVNITYTSNGTVLQNTTYIPSKIDLYGQNITINASEDIVVKRNTKYNQLKKFYWTYYSYEGRYTAGINITNPLTVPLYDVYVYVEFANDSNPDYATVTMRDVANNGIIMKRGDNFDVSAGGIHFYLLSINESTSRTFTFEYLKSQSESYSYKTAEYTVNGYDETIYQGNTYHYFYINWVNTDPLIFRGMLIAKLDFENILDIDPNSIILKDDDNNKVLSSDGFTQAGNLVLLGNSVMGDVNPGGGRSFTVYFIFKEYPGANPEAYTTTTPLFYILTLPITVLLIGLVVFGMVLIISLVLLISNRKEKKIRMYKLGIGISLLIIMLLLFAQAVGL